MCTELFIIFQSFVENYCISATWWGCTSNSLSGFIKFIFCPYGVSTPQNWEHIEHGNEIKHGKKTNGYLCIGPLKCYRKYNKTITITIIY